MDIQEQLNNAKKWLLGIRSRDEAEEGIKKSQLWQQSLATWSKRLGKTAIAIGVVGLLSRSLGILTVAGSVGLAYGTVAVIRPRVTVAGGILFGVATELVIDQTIVPILGLSNPFWKCPVKWHVRGLAAHIVFGIGTDMTRRLLLKLPSLSPARGG